MVRPVRFSPRDYDVDPRTGFFPSEPLPRLPEPYEAWEDTFEAARSVVTLRTDESEDAVRKRAQGERWRESVRRMAVQTTGKLRGDIRWLQRAHMVLASIMHFYVHSLPATEPNVIPKAVAIPLVDVSKALAMAPVLTFADTVLWNWEFIDPTKPLSVDNMRYVNNFSGTEAENNFYLSSAAVELKGVEMLEIFERFMNLRHVTEARLVEIIGGDLTRLSKTVGELTKILNSMKESVDPPTFYFSVRPWWAGSTSDPSRPWVMEGVSGSSAMDLGGASAGQSSVMHALDIFLDIDHKLQTKRVPAPTPNNRQADRGFMERMRRYMPGLHREYLEHLRSVREVVSQHPSLKGPYNDAVMALKCLRDDHIKIVALYVVTKSNATPPPQFRKLSEGDVARPAGPARGTGGSEVSTLLKAGRDATQRALLKEN
ncbi:Indoleamine 2,3-dioxygenase [Wolfiporia cocos MD-104 SS10]|uniref:Indoleamine 2,3-dioxygenase n=1 Tax=Wolfiporia cocos (strain MD-104) TaxID=742152 RepID=A0A2H3JIY8_WOLCO|nr:Indoleamine 2,3-dioxygenase [Wolfiporia cocos MD-104 SS10]